MTSRGREAPNRGGEALHRQIELAGPDQQLPLEHVDLGSLEAGWLGVEQRARPLQGLGGLVVAIELQQHRPQPPKSQQAFGVVAVRLAQGEVALEAIEGPERVPAGESDVAEQTEGLGLGLGVVPQPRDLQRLPGDVLGPVEVLALDPHASQVDQTRRNRKIVSHAALAPQALEQRRLGLGRLPERHEAQGHVVLRTRDAEVVTELLAQTQRPFVVRDRLRILALVVEGEAHQVVQPRDQGAVFEGIETAQRQLGGPDRLARAATVQLGPREFGVGQGPGFGREIVADTSEQVLETTFGRHEVGTVEVQLDGAEHQLRPRRWVDGIGHPLDPRERIGQALLGCLDVTGPLVGLAAQTRPSDHVVRRDVGVEIEDPVEGAQRQEREFRVLGTTRGFTEQTNAIRGIGSFTRDASAPPGRPGVPPSRVPQIVGDQSPQFSGPGRIDTTGTPQGYRGLAAWLAHVVAAHDPDLALAPQLLEGHGQTGGVEARQAQEQGQWNEATEYGQGVQDEAGRTARPQRLAGRRARPVVHPEPRSVPGLQEQAEDPVELLAGREHHQALPPVHPSGPDETVQGLDHVGVAFRPLDQHQGRSGRIGGRDLHTMIRRRADHRQAPRCSPSGQRLPAVVVHHPRQALPGAAGSRQVQRLAPGHRVEDIVEIRGHERRNGLGGYRHARPPAPGQETDDFAHRPLGSLRRPVHGRHPVGHRRRHQPRRGQQARTVRRGDQGHGIDRTQR